MWGGFAYDAEVAAILAASTVCTTSHTPLINRHPHTPSHTLTCPYIAFYSLFTPYTH